MVKPPLKRPARKATPKVAPVRKPKRTPEERKAKAIELLLLAIAGGWTLRRFARLSGVSHRSIMRWVAEPTVQPRYMVAMQTKAITLPDEAMEIVKVLREGGEVRLRPDPDNPKNLIYVFEKVNVKAMAVALRHIEYRMMRELKALYNPARVVEHVGATADLPDERIDARVGELMDKYMKGGFPQQSAATAGENKKSGA